MGASRLWGYLFIGYSSLCMAGLGCTTFYLSNSPNSTVAKNLDWFKGQGTLYINKRNVAKSAALIGTETPLTWVSKYSSVTVTETGRDFPWEGMNEAGLSVGTLELIRTIPPSFTDPRPAVNFIQWNQYILDTSATVAEAISQAEKTRVASPSLVHYFICDASSQCAVLEYLRGNLVVHTGSDLAVRALANDTYSSSLDYFLKQTALTPVATLLASTSNASLDRFTRAALWANNFPSSGQDEVTYAFAGLQNVAEVYLGGRTYWSLVWGLHSSTGHVRTFDAPKIKDIPLRAFNPSCSSGVQSLDVNSPVSGDVTASFATYDAHANQRLADSYTLLTAGERALIGAYPETHTQCLE